MISAQDSISADSSLKIFDGTITNSGYGGIILKFSKFSDQFVVKPDRMKHLKKPILPWLIRNA